MFVSKSTVFDRIVIDRAQFSVGSILHNRISVRRLSIEYRTQFDVSALSDRLSIDLAFVSIIVTRLMLQLEFIKLPLDMRTAFEDRSGNFNVPLQIQCNTEVETRDM
jgi:hypothetical protein